MWQNVNLFKSLDNTKFGYIPLFFYMFEIFHNKNESGGDHKKQRKLLSEDKIIDSIIKAKAVLLKDQ